MNQEAMLEKQLFPLTLDIGFDNLSLDEINDLLKSIGVDTKAEGGMIKDKGLANILAV